MYKQINILFDYTRGNETLGWTFCKIDTRIMIVSDRIIILMVKIITQICDRMWAKYLACQKIQKYKG